jgi:hypothetical protein
MSLIIRLLSSVMVVAVISGTVAATPLRAAETLTVVRLGLLSSDKSANAYDIGTANIATIAAARLRG